MADVLGNELFSYVYMHTHTHTLHTHYIHISSNIFVDIVDVATEISISSRKQLGHLD